MNLATAFEASVNEHPEKIGVFFAERELSYRALWEQTVHVGSFLAGKFDVQKGDRVGLWLKNCPEYIPAVFGVLLAGGVVVPINNFLKPDEVGFILNDGSINVLITDSGMAEYIPALAAARQGLRFLEITEAMPSLPDAQSPTPESCELLKDAASLPGLNSIDESDLALIIYTSGTTGRPKGAMLSHGNLLHNVDSCRQVLRIIGDDRFAVILPFFHSFMLCVGLFLPMLAGGSIVLVKSLHPLKNLLAEIAARRASILPGIPQFFRSLANAPAEIVLLVRVCISGAAPLPKQVIIEWTSKFSVPLLEGYGLSEASPVVSINPLGRPSRPGSIGMPIPNVEVSIQDDTGHPLPVGEVGELCVRGGNVMQGYWQRPDETAKALRNGWLLTGDVGYQDAEGYFYITDRKKDMLLVNGLNVYPREIEEVLYQFPNVKEAAVVGIPDPRKGEQPIAYVSPNDGERIDETRLLEFVRIRLADYKVPRRIIVMGSLPRNSTGKILKTSLRDLARAQEQAGEHEKQPRD